jgi:hypothetical protein
MTTATWRTIQLGASALFLALAVINVSAQENLSYQKLIEEKSPAFVTLKYLLQMGMAGEESEEMEIEITGVMMNAEGLIVCSNAAMGGPMGMVSRMMGGMMRSMGQELRMTPKDIKVFIGDAAEGLPAKLFARDTDLDLAWIQLDAAEGKKFDHIDFSKGATPTLGESIYWIRRLDKHFDRAIVVSEARIGGFVKKPREYYVPNTVLSASGTTSFGLPIFNSSGAVIGITVMHASDEDVDMDNPMGMMGQMFGMAEGLGGMILPAAEVIRATERAKEAGAEEE